jgi:hypothetical protein
VALGALIATIPLLNSQSHWDPWVLPTYIATVTMAFLLSGVCALAARTVRAERADSVADIKSDLDQLLEAYESPISEEETWANVLRQFLQRIRGELRDNQQMLERARESGRYWKVTEGTPATKVWKDNAALLEGDDRLMEVYEQGRRAAREVERVTSARSVRLFSGSRVRKDDRLDEALDVLKRFDELLTQAINEPGGPRGAG